MDLDAPPGRIAVGFDNEQAGYDMTEALLASGKRHIVYFGAMSDARDNKRYRGYCRAMASQGQTPRQIAPHRVSSVSIGADMLAMARERYPQLDGILCTNDDLAVGVLQACLRLGVRVPQEVALSGFHGLDIGQATTPSIASVITPRFDMGKPPPKCCCCGSRANLAPSATICITASHSAAPFEPAFGPIGGVARAFSLRAAHHRPLFFIA